MSRVFRIQTEICFSFLILCLVICQDVSGFDGCSDVCSGKSNVLNYADGTKYRYKLLSTQTVKNPNNEKEDVTLQLKGFADMTKIAGCEYALRLVDLEFTESLNGVSTSPKIYPMFSKMLQELPLRFSYDNGRIQSVCPEIGDNEFSINVKKGVLSSMQVSLDGLDAPNYLQENDISGDCLTDYSTEKDSASFVKVTKTKFLAGCSNNRKYFTKFLERLYDIPTEDRKTMNIDATHKCTMKIKRKAGIMESLCSETIIVKPFNIESGVYNVDIVHELQFVSEGMDKTTFKAPTIKTNLLMQHGEKDTSELSMKEQLPNSKDTLVKICKTISKVDSINAEVTQLFVDLIRGMSDDKVDDIKQLMDTLESNDDCKSQKDLVTSLLFDALASTNTADALSFILKDASTINKYGMTFSSIRNPTAQMIDDLSMKLDVSDKVYLMLANLIVKYCNQNQDCMKNGHLQKSLKAIESDLGADCSEKTKESKIMFAMKALKSIGQISDQLTNHLAVIRQCLDNRMNDAAIKELAIESLRNYPCNSEVDEFLWKIFDDISYNSEFRINAYLALTRCPTKSSVAKLVRTLSQENGVQVGSFMWSHLTQILDSNRAWQGDFRELLQPHSRQIYQLSKRFNLDFRSHSKYFERTLQRTFASAQIDSSLIFTSKSPLPTSLHTNVTFDLLGRNVRFMELGIRSEGMYEKFLAPNILATPHNDVDPNVVKLDQNMKNDGKQLRPRVSIHAKMFGHDLFFTPDVYNSLITSVLSMPPKVSSSKSLFLVDNTISFATISGFPLLAYVGIVGSSQIYLQRNLDIGFNKLKVSGRLNGVIQVTGSIKLNAHCTKIGVQMTSHVSTDSKFGGQFLQTDKLDKDKVNENIYEFVIDKIPDDRKLLSMKNTIEMVHNLKKVETMPKMEKIIDQCTSDGLEKVLRMKLCIEASRDKTSSFKFPNAEASITIKKFSGFRFKFESSTDKSVAGLPKYRKMMFSMGFMDTTEDSFRLSFDRNMKEKQQTYEILMWNKKIYLKVNINNDKITGEALYGAIKATLSGTYISKNVLNTDINVKIEGDFKPIKFYFQQAFSKAGPQIIVKAEQEGKDSFYLNSRTDLKIPKHKIYNYFERYRHSTQLKLPGMHDMKVVLNYELGNKPAVELKTNLNAYWKTNEKYKFKINNKYEWNKRSQSAVDLNNISGTNYTVVIQHEIEYKEKKYNIQNMLHLFMSKGFYSFGVIQNDLIRNERRLYFVTKFGYKNDNNEGGKVLVEQYVDYLKNYTGSTVFNFQWTPKKMKNTMRYLITSKLSVNEKDHFMLSYMPQSESITKTEVVFALYKKKVHIISTMTIPKTHNLVVNYTTNDKVYTYKLNSEVIKLNLVPVQLEMSHVFINYNNSKYTAKNIISYDNKNKTYFMELNVKDQNQEFFGLIKMSGKMDYLFSQQSFYILDSFKIEMKIPSMNIDKIMTRIFSMLYFYKNPLSRDGKIFQLVSTDIDKIKNQTTGVSINFSRNDGYLTFIRKIYTGKETETLRVKGKMVGIKSEFEFYLVSPVLFKTKALLKFKLDESSYSRTIFIESLKNNSYDFYYKTESKYKRKGNNMSYKVEGEYSIDKTKKKNKIKVDLIYQFDWKKKIEMTMGVKHPLFLNFGVVNMHSSFIFDRTPSKSKGDIKGKIVALVKWQMKEDRKSKYYELRSKLNIKANGKKFNFDIKTAKDSMGKSKLPKLYFKYDLDDAEFNTGFIMLDKFGDINLKFTKKFDFSKEIAGQLLITSSNENLNEFKYKFKTELHKLFQRQGQYNGKHEITVKTANESYSFTLTSSRKFYDTGNKLECVENIQWTSNFIESGTVDIGLLSSFKYHRFIFKLIKSSKKLIDAKVSIDTSLKTLEVLLSSSIVKSIKVGFNYAQKNDTTNGSIDLVYDKNYLKIPNWKLYYKVDEKSAKMTSDLVLKSTFENFENVEYSDECSYIMGDIKSLVMKSILKYNSKVIQELDVDLTKGIMKYETTSAKYKTLFGFETMIMNLNYKYTSLKDNEMNFEYMLKPDKLDMKMNWVYYRGNSKLIKDLGEAYMYNKLYYKRNDNLIDHVIFVNKDITGGSHTLKVDLPKYNISIKDFSLKNLKMTKVSNTIYTGEFELRGSKYKFTHTVTSPLNKKFMAEKISGNTKPQIWTVSYDFDQKIMFSAIADDYFDFTVNVLKTGGDIRLKYDSKKLVNLAVTRKATLPFNTFAENFKAYFTMKTGFDVMYTVKGKVWEKDLDHMVKLYRMKSTQFEDGVEGLIKVNYKCGKVDYKLEAGVDREWPKYQLLMKESLKMDNEDIFDFSTNTKFISLDNFKMDVMMKLKKQIVCSSIIQYDPNLTQLKFDYNIYKFLAKYNKILKAVTFSIQFDDTKMYTVETNLPLVYTNYRDTQVIFSENNTYYLNYNDYKVSITKKGRMQWDFLYYDPTRTKPLKFTMTYDSQTKKLTIDGSSDYEVMKFFTGELQLTLKNDFEFVSLNSFVKLNKKLFFNNKITQKFNNNKWKLNVDHEGGYIVYGEMSYDMKYKNFTHFIQLKEMDSKRDLWTSESECVLGSEFICYLEHTNKARKLVIGGTFTQPLMEIEVSWNKKKGQSLILKYEKLNNQKSLTLNTPLRSIELKSNRDAKTFAFNLIKNSGSPSDNLKFNMKYGVTGSFMNDYKVMLEIESNIIDKKLILVLERTMDMGTNIYEYKVDMKYDGSKMSLFTLKSSFGSQISKNFIFKVDMQTSSNLISMVSETTLSLEHILMDVKILKDKKEFSTFVFEIIPMRKFLIMHNDRMEIRWERSRVRNGYKGTAVVKLDNVGPNIEASSTFTRNPMKYYAEIKSNNKKLVIHMRPTLGRFYGEIYRNVDGQKYLDGFLSIKKDNDNLVKSELYWKPDIFENSKMLFKDVFSPSRMKDILTQCFDTFNAEMSQLCAGIKDDISSSINLQQVINSAKSLVIDAEQLPKFITQIYDNDDLYIKKILTTVKDIIEKIGLKKRLESLSENLYSGVVMVKDEIYSLFIEAKLYKMIYQPIKKGMDSLTYTNMKQSIFPLEKTLNNIINSWKSLIFNIGDYFDYFSMKIGSGSKAIQSMYNDMESFIKQTKMYEIFEIMREIRKDVLIQISEAMKSDIVKQRLEYYKDIINSVKIIISGVKIVRDEALRYVKSTNFVSSIIETWKLLKEMRYKEAFMNMMKPELTKLEMDLNKANINFQFYMPPLMKPAIMMTRTVFNSIPFEAIIQTGREGLTNKLLQIFYRYEYAFFNYKSLDAWKNMLPPFKRTAYVINGNLILTYDGHSIKIGEKPCSYLLARDIRDKSFTVTLTNTAKPTFTVNYFKKVEVDTNTNQVKIDGQPVSTLPQMYQKSSRKLYIYRSEDYIKIKTDSGLKVKYFFDIKTFQFTLAGHWHGKVRGLLGSNDFDNINDLSEPTGRIITDFGILAQRWMLEKCDSGTKTGLYMIRVNPKRLNRCVELFNRESSGYLSRCYGYVDPEPYLELCSKSLQYNYNDDNQTQLFEDEIACPLSRSYVNRCNDKNLLLRLEKSCVKCGSVSRGKKISSVKASSIESYHYLFIIEQTGAKEAYKSVINKLVETLNLRKNSRFSLLAFNSDAYKNWPHFKSIDGEISVDYNQFKKLLGVFWNPAYLAKSSKSTNLGMEAIFKALKLTPTNMKGREKIIFIGDTECKAHKKYSYSLLANMLKDYSFTYLTGNDFTGVDRADGVGIDSRSEYKYNKEDIINTSPKVNSIIPTKDSCSALALLEGGSVWSLQMMTNEMRIRRVTEKINEVMHRRKPSDSKKNRNCYCSSNKFEIPRVTCKLESM